MHLIKRLSHFYIEIRLDWIKCTEYAVSANVEKHKFVRPCLISCLFHSLNWRRAISWSEASVYLFHFNLLHRVHQFRNKEQTYCAFQECVATVQRLILVFVSDKKTDKNSGTESRKFQIAPLSIRATIKTCMAMSWPKKEQAGRHTWASRRNRRDRATQN